MFLTEVTRRPLTRKERAGGISNAALFARTTKSISVVGYSACARARARIEKQNKKIAINERVSGCETDTTARGHVAR